MKLRRCSVGGIMYGLASDSGAFHSSTMWNILNGGNGNGNGNGGNGGNGNGGNGGNGNVNGNGGNGNGGNGGGGSSSSSALRTRELSDFWTCLSVCHTVVVEEEDVPASQEQEEEADHHSHHSHNNSRQSIDRLTQATRSGSAHRLPRPIGLKKRVYRAESPDEGALFRLGYGYFCMDLISNNTRCSFCSLRCAGGGCCFDGVLFVGKNQCCHERYILVRCWVLFSTFL